VAAKVALRSLLKIKLNPNNIKGWPRSAFFLQAIIIGRASRKNIEKLLKNFDNLFPLWELLIIFD
jgi:hypothetical protein